VFIGTSHAQAGHKAEGAHQSAEALLSQARLRPTSHPVTLSAEIRGADASLPLIVKIEKNQITYQLDHPEETIVVTIEPHACLLGHTQHGVSSLMNNEERYHDIRGTGVTYDDLSLDFLYWPSPRLAGKETLRGLKTTIIELIPPTDAKTPYGSARLWMDQQSGAPLRMEGWNHQGKLLKRFEMIAVQKIDGVWMLKEMRIETLDPESGTILQRRYLNLHFKLKNEH
jgi:hypothetical protein